MSLTCKRFRDVVKGGCEPEYNLRGKRIDDPFALMERLIGTKASGTHLQSGSFTFPDYLDEWETFTSLQKLVLRIESPYVEYDTEVRRTPEYVKCLSPQARSLEDIQLCSTSSEHDQKY